MSWEGPLGTIVEAPGDQVFVALYDVTPEDEKALDEWEGVEIGLWTKVRVRVATLDGEVLAWCYVLTAYEGGLPTARYLGLIADAAEAAGHRTTTSSRCATAPAAEVEHGPSGKRCDQAARRPASVAGRGVTVWCHCLRNSLESSPL